MNRKPGLNWWKTLGVILSFLWTVAFMVPSSFADETYSSDEIIQIAGEFFGGASEGLASIIEKAFSDLGRPNGFIAGEEISGAFVLGFRYGKGTFRQKNKKSRKVFWRGPSVGWDFGGNAARVFTLVYNIEFEEQLFYRFSGVDGSLYFVAGIGVNYQERGSIVLAPIRTGVGIRAGASVGYLNYSEKREWLLF